MAIRQRSTWTRGVGESKWQLLRAGDTLWGRPWGRGQRHPRGTACRSVAAILHPAASVQQAETTRERAE